MPGAPGISSSSTRKRGVFAGLLVMLTVVGVWKFIDYRTQPPPPPSIAIPR